MKGFLFLAALACAGPMAQPVFAQFMRGTVVMPDGSAPTQKATIERVCPPAKPVQETVADKRGEFVWRINNDSIANLLTGIGNRMPLRCFLRAGFRPLLPVEHVRTCDLVRTRAHERQLDLVLDVFDVERSARGLPARQRAHDGLGERRDQLTDPRGRCALPAFDGEERLGHGDRNLRRLEADHGAVAPDHLVL